MLRTRLYLGLLPLLLLFLVVGVYALMVCRSLARSIEDDLVRNYRTLIAGYELRTAASRMHAALTQWNRSDTRENRRAFEEERSRLKRLLFDQSVASSGTPRVELVERILEAQQELVDQAEVSQTSPQLPRALDRYRAAEGRFFGALAAIEALAQQDYAHVQTVSAQTADTVKLAINLLAAAMVGAVLLSLFLSYRLARTLLQPIQAITASARALGEGRLETTVPVVSGDELGQMAEVFNDMAARLRHYRDAMKEEVRRAQRTTEATLTASPDPVVIVSREGATELINPAAQELGLGAGAWPEALSAAVQHVLKEGQHDVPTGYDRVLTLRTTQGERHFLPRILAIDDRMTGMKGAAVILQDVTKFRLLDDAKNNLVGTVSHELKTPLTSLRLSVYLLLEANLGPLTADQRELLETARDGADRLLRIMDDLLDLSRMEAGVSALHRAQVPVDQLLSDMTREMKPLVEAAGQRLEIECDPEAGCVWVDRDRIRHVFINLLSNASKYSPAGKTITVYARPADPGFVRCGVRDQGPGIPAESAARVFDRFYRVPGETKMGAGLGLTIAREIVVAHGGSIACSSEPGSGCDFHFVLPRAS